MTKLSVAEASKRGYATGLSILQAVQKNWLTAEKAADGQLLVDVNDLEKIFGLPSSTPPLTDTSNGQPNGVNGEHSEPEIYDDDELAMDVATVSDIVADDSYIADTNYVAEAEFVAEPDTSDTDETATQQEPSTVYAPTPQSPESDRDRAELLAEIEQLRMELDSERRHIAALLDVLTNRVLPPSGTENGVTSDADESWNETTEINGIGEDENLHSAAEIIEPEDSEPGLNLAEDSVLRDSLEEPQFEETEVEESRTEEFGLRDSPPDFSEAEDTDIAVPIFSADVRTRLTPPSDSIEREAAEKPGSGGFFWRLWLLMAVVWAGMIGTFYWFVFDLPTHLTAVRQWIDGSIAADEPAMVAAWSATADAARDTLGPPALLLVVMLVMRWGFRQLRS